TIFRKWRVRLGPVKAALLTSLVFCALHADKVVSFIGALTYVLAFTRTRSLWGGVVLHILHNIQALALVYGWDHLVHLASPWECAIYALVLLGGVGIWLQFASTSWRTLGDPLPPDSLSGTAIAPPAGVPEPLLGG